MYRFIVRILVAMGAVLPAVTLAEDVASHSTRLTGQNTTLVVPTAADAYERKAADLLQQWLRRATRQRDGFEITTEDKHVADPAKLVLALGRTRWAEANQLASLWHDGLVVRRSGNCIVIAGATPRGTLFGAVRFLDRFCGVRFYLPDPLFTSLPKDCPEVPASIALREEPFVRAASMSGPLAVPGYNDHWLLPLAGNTRADLAGTHQHNMWQAFPPDQYALRWPEIYPLIQGARYIPKDARDQKWNPCLSEPQLLAAAEQSVVAYYREHPAHLWYSLGLQDSHVMCQCDRCTAAVKSHVERDPQQGRVTAYSELYWRFMNTLAERLEPRLPGKRIEGLAYSVTRFPPPLKLHPNVVVFTNFHIAELDADGILKPSADGLTPVDRWLKVASIYGNHDWHQGSGYLIPRIYSGYWSRFMRHLKQKLPYTYQHAETYPNFGLDGAKAYVLARMWWDPDLEPRTLWRQFCDDMFGPAAAPMAEYFTTLEALWIALDNAGGPERKLNRWSNQFVTTAADRALIATCRRLLNRAAALAQTAAQQKRVDLFSKTFRLSEYLFEFAAAAKVSAARIEAAKRHAREAILPDPLTLFQNMRSPEVIDAAIRGAVGAKVVEP